MMAKVDVKCPVSYTDKLFSSEKFIYFRSIKATLKALLGPCEAYLISEKPERLIKRGDLLERRSLFKK